MCDRHYRIWLELKTQTPCPPPDVVYRQKTWTSADECHCGRKAFSRSLCRKHYLAEQYADREPPTIEEQAKKILPRIVEQDNGCWEWTGAKDHSGYGRYGYAAHGRVIGVMVHRWMWEYLVGPITEKTLDHLCRNKSCCNPAHLEPVSMAENIRRAAPFRPKKYRKKSAQI